MYSASTTAEGVTEGFAPVPGAEEVREWIAGLDDPGLSDAERVDRLREAEALKARLAAVQARLSVGLAGSQARRQDRARRSGARGPVAAQVALARRESLHRASSLLGLATVLVREMPHTLARLEAGEISEWDATLVARETACLSLEDRRRVDEGVCGDPSGIVGWGHRRFAVAARSEAYALDPHAATSRAARARADRHVGVRPAPDTMVWLGALLPVEQGVAVHAALQRAAAGAAGQADDPRSRGQVMADTLVERVTGRSAATEVPLAVNLTVSDETLLAGGHEPAWVQAAGVAAEPVPADLARDLVARSLATSVATLRRLYVAPRSGSLVAMDARARCFPAALGRFLDLRDQTCRTPYCDAPVRHHDHPWTWAGGGETSGRNGQGLCAGCNHAKQGPGWRAFPATGPPGGFHTIETRTPTGHRHRSREPGQPVPSRLLPRMSRAEIGFHSLVLAG